MNDVLAAAPRRYALSFTTGALLAREATLLAPVYIEQRDWEQVRDLPLASTDPPHGGPPGKRDGTTTVDTG
jgi:hypothetical protein